MKNIGVKKVFSVLSKGTFLRLKKVLLLEIVNCLTNRLKLNIGMNKMKIMKSLQLILGLSFSLMIFSCVSPYLTNGKTQYENKNYEMAIIELKKAIEVSPENLEAHYYLGLCYYLTNKYDLAFTEFFYVQLKNPNYPGVAFMLDEARVQRALNSTISWNELIEQLSEIKTDLYQYKFITIDDVPYLGEIGYLLYKGYKHYHANEYTQALHYFMQGLEFQPDNESIKTMAKRSVTGAARNAEKNDDIQAAVASYEAYLQQIPDDKFAQNQVSRLKDKIVLQEEAKSLQEWVMSDSTELELEEVLFLSKKLKKYYDYRPVVINTLEHFRTEYPDHVLADEVQYELGACRFRQADRREELYGEALQEFRAVQTDNDTLAAKTLYMIARCYREMGMIPEAESYYQQVVELHPDYRLADDALFLIGYLKKDYAQAVPIYREVIAKFPDGDVTDGATARLGWVLYSMEQYDAAIEVFHSLLQNYPDFDYRYWWGYRYLLAAYQSKEDFGSMESTLEELLEENLDKGKQEVTFLAKLYYYKFNDRERATEILKLIPNWAENESIKALVTFFETGDFQKYLVVAKPVRKEVDIMSDDPFELYQSATKVWWDPTQAISLLRRAQNHQPGDTLGGRIDFKIGKYLMQVSEYWEAAKLFDTLKSPEIQIEARAEFLLGECYHQLREKKLAERVYRDIAQAPWNEEYRTEALYKQATLQYNAEVIEGILNNIIEAGPHGTSTNDASNWLTALYYKLYRDYRGTVDIVDQHLEKLLGSALPAGTLYYKGLALTYLGEEDAAADLFEQLYESSNYYSIDGFCALHDYLRYEKGKITPAQEIVQRARSIFTDDSVWLSGLITLREQKYDM